MRDDIGRIPVVGILGEKMKVCVELSDKEWKLLQDSFLLYALDFERPDVTRVIEKINKQYWRKIKCSETKD